MSRTFKDKPNYLQQIRRNEEELNRAYIREKRFKQDRFQNIFHNCMDCPRAHQNDFGMCKECSEQSIEDLVTVYENCQSY